MLLSLIPAATTMAHNEPPEAIRKAEWKMLAQVNQVRARNGVGPLRMATRVRLAARDRSRSMKNSGYFAHVSPAGVDAADLMNRRSIGFSRWGENIGYTKHYKNLDGVRTIVQGWKDSPGHRRNMLDRNFNYAGIGIARKGAKVYYTLVLVRQRDHTPPKAGLVDARGGLSIASAGRSADVTVRWWGRDRKLSVGTAGLRGFNLHYKRPNGTWRPLLRNTTRRSYTAELGEGTHKFRVRAVDRKGNRGSWMRPLTVTVN